MRVGRHIRPLRMLGGESDCVLERSGQFASNPVPELRSPWERLPPTAGDARSLMEESYVARDGLRVPFGGAAAFSKQLLSGAIPTALESWYQLRWRMH